MIIANDKSISRKEEPVKNISISGLNIKKPSKESTQFIMQKLNLTLQPGEHTLIQGQSGLGKSTLFKAISGTWKYGEGNIVVPSGKSMYFLPQKPTLPNDTIKAVLAYPQHADTYTDEQYHAALNAVGGLEQFISQLNKKDNWSGKLSGGQQQRISFVSALLKRPDWLFLDEATSALDEPSELHVYSTLTQQLKDTTIVSIAHRSTVEKHHNRVVFFSAKNDNEIEVTDKKYAPAM